jgi:hypothetical protein
MRSTDQGTVARHTTRHQESTMRKALALAALLAALPWPALAREVGGVQLPDAVTVGGKELRLNGAGIRKKFIISVYVGALYVATPSADPGAIVEADEPKRVRMIFLRDVDRKSIQGAFREGFEKNNPADAQPRLMQGLETIGAALADVKKGGEIVLTYEPGAGTTVTGPTGQSVTVPGTEFAKAIFRNWLGPKVADGDLKAKMLGR